MMTADGFEEAVLGYGTHFNTEVVIYDYQKCVKVLMDRDSMDYDEAVEFMEFNVCGAWVGEGSPVFLREGPSED